MNDWRPPPEQPLKYENRGAVPYNALSVSGSYCGEVRATEMTRMLLSAAAWRASARVVALPEPRLLKTPLLRVDQLTANRAGEVFVCEDIATDEIDIGLIDRHGRVSKFLSATGPDHVGSELTGVTFDPSGSRMYFSSQRAFGKDGLPGPGAIYEVSGPFRGSRAFHATAHSA